MADYQRIFAEHPPQPGYCLLLRPFNAPADRAWNAVRRHLDATFHWTDIRELIRSGTIMDQILTEIARTDVVVVDITGNNPNVFFELGIARLAKPDRKVIIVRREGDEDDGPQDPDHHPEGVVPFDVRSERYLPFVTTDAGIADLVPSLTARLWDGLEQSQRFLIAERGVHHVGHLEGADGSGVFDVSVQPTGFVDRGFGPHAGRAHVTVTMAPVPASVDVEREQAVPPPLRVTGSLGREETMSLAPLPWRLKFHGFEGDQARLCLESVESRRTPPPL